MDQRYLPLTAPSHARVPSGATDCRTPALPRLIDLTRIRERYVRDLSAGEQTWIELADAGTGAERLKTVAEDILLRFAVGWESFVSDWYIGAINHDASAFRTDLQQKLENWLDSAVAGSPYARRRQHFPNPHVAIGNYPAGKTIREILDPQDRNIEFRALDDLADRANRELVQAYRTRVHQVRVGGGDEIIAATQAIRNVLAHRSENAVRRMNGSIAAMPSYPALRKPTMSDQGIGTYLKAAAGPAGEARLILFQRELANVATALSP